jgi:hypothetical protein
MELRRGFRTFTACSVDIGRVAEELDRQVNAAEKQFDVQFVGQPVFYYSPSGEAVGFVSTILKKTSTKGARS